jgi:hypothetical protein
MMEKFYALSGMLSPAIFIFLTLLGGYLRPGYSHVADTISELFSPGAPNKKLLVPLHLLSALFTILFGIGVLNLVRGSEGQTIDGLIGAGLIILIGTLNVLTATIFPQDAWGTEPTCPGEMHKVLVGIMAVVSLVSTLLIGLWFSKTQIFSGFGLYSFISVGIIFLAGGYSLTKLGTPLMGLTERLAIFAGLQWNFVLGLMMFTS